MKSQPNLNELKLELLESFSKHYDLIVLTAKGKLPIEAIPPGLIRGILHYIAGDICLHKIAKREAREKN